MFVGVFWCCLFLFLVCFDLVRVVIFLSVCFENHFPCNSKAFWFHVGSMFVFDLCFWVLLCAFVCFASCFKMFICCLCVCVCVVFSFRNTREDCLILCILLSGSFLLCCS